MDAVSKMDDKQLHGLMKMLSAGKQKKKELPPINGDFYDMDSKLNGADRELQLKVRDFMEAEVKPIVNKYWLRDEFPFEIVPKLAAFKYLWIYL
jgi:glutaryl-CoA dehydrogenase